MKTTPLHEIPELEDKVPVLAVEGSVKYAMEVKHSPPGSEKAWSRQFFVLAQGTDEVGCTMWDAEGNAMEKGEHVRIEATQNKKKQWTGMMKGSYEKDGERKHTLEIRANNVKIINLDAEPNPLDEKGDFAHAERRPSKRPSIEHGEDYLPDRDEDWTDAPVTAPELPLPSPEVNRDVVAAKIHLVKSCNLYNLCIDAAVACICPHVPEEQRTNEQFQSTLASIWIEASSRRSDDGKVWWSWIDRMPSTPIKKS